MPVAVEPLPIAVRSDWVIGRQLKVLWQESQDADVAMWLEGLPFAVVPLWHVAQVPGATPV